MASAPDSRSIGELFSDLTRDMSVLIRKEVELARVELSTMASAIGARVAIITVGAVIACAGLYAIVAGLVLIAIELGLTPWAASLLVGALVLIIGGLIAKQSFDGLRALDLTPRETVRTLKENAEWAKEHTTR